MTSTEKATPQLDADETTYGTVYVTGFDPIARVRAVGSDRMDEEWTALVDDLNNRIAAHDDLVAALHLLDDVVSSIWDTAEYPETDDFGWLRSSILGQLSDTRIKLARAAIQRAEGT